MISMAFSSDPRCWLRTIASVFALKLPWLAITSRGTPVEPEVGIKTARSSSVHGAGRNELAGRAPKLPSICVTPFFLAQSQWTPLPTHTAFPRALARIDSPEVASARSSTSTGTSPAYMAPKYASVLAGLKAQLISTRSPACRPVDRNPAAKPKIRPGTSLPESVCPVAASIRREFSPSRRSKRPAKFESLDPHTLDLAELALNDPADLFHVLHRH